MSVDPEAAEVINRLKETALQQREDLANRLIEQQEKSVQDRLDLLNEMLQAVALRDERIMALQDQLNNVREQGVERQAEVEQLQSLIKPVVASYRELASVSFKFHPGKKYNVYKSLLAKLNTLYVETNGNP